MKLKRREYVLTVKQRELLHEIRRMQDAITRRTKAKLNAVEEFRLAIRKRHLKYTAFMEKQIQEVLSGERERIVDPLNIHKDFYSKE